jgi:cytochrome c peroxidase
LGRLLFFDPRLSKDDSISCASCHSPEHAFTDGQPNSKGMAGQRGNRSAPTTLNRAYSLAQFWDGRAASLEDQAKGPMANPIEMAHTHDGVVSKLNMIVVIARDSRKFSDRPKSISIRSRRPLRLSNDAAIRQLALRSYKAGQKAALTPSQIRGLDIFVNKAKCDQCHEGSTSPSNSYHNLGVGMDRPNPDPGRSEVTKDPRDLGAFKTPRCATSRAPRPTCTTAASRRSKKWSSSTTKAELRIPTWIRR